MALPPLPEISNFKDWHIPWEKDQYTLKECLDNLALLGAPPDKIPLMVKLVENPKYRIPGVTLFHGAVELKQHDCIHALLGRDDLARVCVRDTVCLSVVEGRGACVVGHKGQRVRRDPFVPFFPPR